MALELILQTLSEERKSGETNNQIVTRLKNTGKIPNDKLQDYQRTASAADYALDRQEMIEEQIRYAMGKVDKQSNERGFMAELKRNMDRSLFTQKRHATKEISDPYFNLVMRCAMVMYGNEIVKTH